MLAFGSANAQPAGGFQRVDAQLTGRPVPRTFGGQLPEMNVKYDAYVAAPEGFDKERPDIAKGTLEETTYESKTVGTTRKITVYLPPKYDKSKKYPVLYLLHGIGGDHREWLQGVPGIIMDNLYADQKAVPMIIVMPNGRAQENDRAEGNVYAPEMDSPPEEGIVKFTIASAEGSYTNKIHFKIVKYEVLFGQDIRQIPDHLKMMGTAQTGLDRNRLLAGSIHQHAHDIGFVDTEAPLHFLIDLDHENPENHQQENAKHGIGNQDDPGIRMPETGSQQDDAVKNGGSENRQAETENVGQ